MENKVKVDLAKALEDIIEKKVELEFGGKEYEFNCSCQIQQGSPDVEIDIKLIKKGGGVAGWVTGPMNILEIMESGEIDLDKLERTIYNG